MILQVQHALILQNMQVAERYTSTGGGQLAPITGNDSGVKRAEIRQGVREIILCKDQKGKIGLRLRSVNKVTIIIGSILNHF